MSSITTISSYGQACLRHRWEVSDGCNIVAYAFYITGRVWALNGGRV